MRDISHANVAVIGGAGFLGSHLVEYLSKTRHCNVLVIDNLITGRREHIPDGVDFKWFDIRDDARQLAAILTKHSIEYVFSYAAEPYIPECFERPMHFFDINARAVLNVLEASTWAEVKGILQVSSAEIYGDSKGKIKETDKVEPHSTYGVSKLAADSLVQVRWKEARTPAIALRQFNCVGERETHEYVIPEIMSQLLHKNLVRLGNNSTRDFLYAGDAVRMAVELLEKGEFGEVYNMGSEQAISIYDLAEMIGYVTGWTYPVTIQTNPDKVRPWEIWHLQSDNTKLYSVIDSRPEVDLRTALEKTWTYFVKNGNRWAF